MEIKILEDRQILSRVGFDQGEKIGRILTVQVDKLVERHTMWFDNNGNLHHIDTIQLSENS